MDDDIRLDNESRPEEPTLMLEDGGDAMEILVPDSDDHARVLSYLVHRIEASERKMENFYARWRVAERRSQAYISLPDYEAQLRAMNESSAPPKVVSITVPYTFATLNTIVTYLMQAFTGRKPMFPTSANRGEHTRQAKNMETLLQYNSEHVRMVKLLWQYFHDGELYGLQVLRTEWAEKKAMRTEWSMQPKRLLGIELPFTKERVSQSVEKTIFQGTECLNIDPFMFFPDPRCPMAEVSTKGEFVFWRTFEGRHVLKRAEADGLLKYVDRAGTRQESSRVNSHNNGSNRDLLSRGEAHPGADRTTHEKSLGASVQVDQGTVEIVPAELGLGTSTRPEKWLFTILNKKQIVQAQRFDADHGQHPVVVGEPYTMGYGFGQAAISDYLGPLQDTIGWLVNSHMHNVRTSLNNMWVVDPSMVELGDLRNPEPGKLIRLKRAAYGRDIRTVIQQLQVQDVTRGHMSDLPIFMRLADTLTAVTDNIRGVQDSGGRKSATEARIGADAAASRLASHTRLISGQSIVNLETQMCLNYQQYLSDEFAFDVLGPDGIQNSVKVSPENIAGDFYFPINDGTLPMDKVALMDVWKEIFMAVAQDPQLRGGFDIMKLFEYIAELSGAKNVQEFRIQPGSPEQMAAMAQAGNAIPIGPGGAMPPPAGGPM